MKRWIGMSLKHTDLYPVHAGLHLQLLHRFPGLRDAGGAVIGHSVLHDRVLHTKHTQSQQYQILPAAAGAKQTESTGDLVQAPWSFSSSSERLVKGIFVKTKPNVLSSGDIALASTLISTCLSTDELLLSGTRVVENGPITWGQTYQNNIDSL